MFCLSSLPMNVFLRVPILNADRFLTGLVTHSMLISLISQVSCRDRCICTV